MKKRILTLFLAICMICTLLPFTAFAATTKSGKCGDNAEWTFKDGLLTISGKGAIEEGDWFDSGINDSEILSIFIIKGITAIGDETFFGYLAVKSINIPDSVKKIGNMAFMHDEALVNINIPNSVTSIGELAFCACLSLKSIVIPNSVTSVGPYAFWGCSALKSIAIPNSVKSIGEWTFADCTALQSVTIPKSVTSIGENAFENDNSLKNVYYEGTKDQWNKIAINNENNGNNPLLNATIHYNCTGPYNLGEETYSFKNYVDLHSNGHCFGMSMTSAGYYLRLLDSTNVGAVNGNIYNLSKNKNVKKPICYYQEIQGSKSNKAVVAGGSYYLHRKFDIYSDWESVINYVKNHKYDDKGMLQIGFRKDGAGGHAIDFLRYKVVDGEERIYAYDNNFPTIETYFYKGSDGKIYQAPKSTFGTAIDCIALRDVNKYFKIVGNYFGSDKDTSTADYLKHVIFAEKGTVSVKDATRYPIEVDTEGTEYVVFEVPESVDTANITPLEDNATFIYLDEEYSFDNADGKKGVLKLSDSVDNNNATWKISSDKNSKNPFSDVSKSAYCYKPVMWAYSHDPQITSGVDKTHFAPNNECTRAQIVTFLWRANGCPEVKGIKNPFKDVSKDAFYYNAVLWAVSEGITAGVDKTHFAPNTSCTRGQAVTFLWRADGQPNALITKCPFKDVTKGAFYYDAMLWAVGRNITNGIDTTHFAPNNTCTRGQIVTFLYRDMA